MLSDRHNGILLFYRLSASDRSKIARLADIQFGHLKWHEILIVLAVFLVPIAGYPFATAAGFELFAAVVGAHAILFVWLFFYTWRQVQRRAVEEFLDVECKDGRFRRCYRCDYDLRGSVDWRCPECGVRIGLDEFTSVSPGEPVPTEIDAP
ncbi:MAG: hypothetical protein WD042_05230 [Phycisphaeraceae bacterium]